MGKLVTKTETTTTTKETGEFIKETRETVTESGYIPNQEPPYIKLYLKDIMYLSDLPDRYAKVLYALLQRSSYVSEEGMIVCVTAGSKRLICKQLEMKSVQTISNALSEMTKAKILKRIETGVYALNPHLFGRGDWTKIAKLRLDLNYELNERTFKAAIEYRKRHEIDVTPRPEKLTAGVGEALGEAQHETH